MTDPVRRFDPEDAVPLAHAGYSNYKIGEIFGVNESTVRRGLDRIGFRRHLLPLDNPERYAFDIDKPIVIEGDSIVTADWHIPLYSPERVNEVIELARLLQIKTLIIGGDFFNFDALSQYDPKQTDAGLEREYAEGLAVMRVVLETFDRVIYIWGNHDSRMHKALGFKMRFAEAMKMVFGALGEEAMAKIEFSNLDHCIIRSGDEEFYVCHPANYSSVPLNAARKIANKMNMNVITAHSHHCAVGFAEDGKKIIMEAGGLFEKSKTAYLQRSTTFPTWTQGFVVIQDGRPQLHSPRWGVNAA